MAKCAILLFFSLFAVAAAHADIYKYIDENGVICFTDSVIGNKAVTVLRERSIPTASRSSSRGLQYQELVSSAALKYQLEPELIKAVIRAESNWNRWAVSKKGAIGLMQLMPSTARSLSVANPYDPEENIHGGARYLRMLLEKFDGDLELALAAYNAGPARVEQYGGVPPFSETRDYISRIFSYYRGKRNYSLADFGYTGDSTRIVKVTLEDGTILFTNLPQLSSSKSRF